MIAQAFIKLAILGILLIVIGYYGKRWFDSIE